MGAHHIFFAVENRTDFERFGLQSAKGALNSRERLVGLNGTNIKGCLMKNESIYRGFWLKQMDESCKKQRRLPKVSAIRPYLRQENRQCGIGIPACGPGIKSGTKDSPGFRVRMTFTTLSSDDM